MNGFWWAENDDYSLDYRIDWLLFRPFCYVPPAVVPQTSAGGPSSRERIYIRSLRLNVISIRTLLSQPIFVEVVAQRVNGLSGVGVCCVLFFVVDKPGIFPPLWYGAAEVGQQNFLAHFFHKSGEMRGVLRI